MANSDEVNKKSKVSVLCIYQYYAHVMHSLIKELYINLKKTRQRDRISLLVKLGLNKIILFKYCADVENCESLRGFSLYIYIYRERERERDRDNLFSFQQEVNNKKIYFLLGASPDLNFSSLIGVCRSGLSFPWFL